MNQVWRKAQYAGGELLVLLALADWADDDGRCWPSLIAMATKARLSKRQVCRIVSRLRDDGVLSRVAGNGRGNRTHYQIKSDVLSPFMRSRKSDADDTVSTAERVTSAHTKGDICDLPLIGTVKEPSIKTKTTTTPQAAFVLPDFIPSTEWNAWLEVRKRKRAADTVYAMQLAVKKLREYQQRGFSPKDVLDQSILRSWTGLFEPASKTGGSNGHHYESKRDREEREFTESLRRMEAEDAQATEAFASGERGTSRN